MKRLTVAAAVAALMLVAAPRLHAQAAQQGKKQDTTATAKKASAKKSSTAKSASAKTAAKSDAAPKTASSKSRKAHKSTKKADTTAAKKSE